MAIGINFRHPVEKRFLQHIVEHTPPHESDPNHEAYALFWAIQKAFSFLTRKTRPVSVNADMVVQLATCVNIALMEHGKGEVIHWNDYSGAMNHMYSSFIDSIILAVQRNELIQKTDGLYLNLLLIPDWFIEDTKKADWIDNGEGALTP